MKKAYVFTLSSCVLLCIFFSPVLPLYGSPSAEREKEAGLVVYAYDSFVSECGPAGKVIPKFEAKYGIKVRVLSVGDAGQVLNRAILEKDSPKADIILGIDNNMLSRALEEQILQPYRSPNLSLIPEDLIFDKSYHVTPFDYGYFAIVYDSQSLSNPPRNLEELTDSRFKKKIILQDPRTSSPGLGFLLWTIAVYGDGYLDYWKRLQPSILTITEGWDSAYGIFTNGEAPMVMSYTTSPAYHVEFEQTKRYLALIFEEGNYRQVEGMGILKSARHRDAARKFIDFILTEDFQMEIPLTNWMYPVNPDTKIPDSYQFAPKPRKSLMLDADTIRENQEKWLRDWYTLIIRP